MGWGGESRAGGHGVPTRPAICSSAFRLWSGYQVVDGENFAVPGALSGFRRPVIVASLKLL